MTRLRAGLAALLAVLAALPLLAPAASAATGARVSFTEVQSDFMCVACHEPLAVAQSPEAFSERAYVRQLIAQGLNRGQIDRTMVAQYGPAVLTKPPAKGFNLLLYVLPPVVLVLGVGFLVYTLPRWRRSTRQSATQTMVSGDPPVRLDPDDARRLDEDLARQA